MTRNQIESAVESGIPFTLRMADGKEYPVPHPDRRFKRPRQGLDISSSVCRIDAPMRYA